MSRVLSKWFSRYLSQPEAIALLIIFIMTIAIFKVMGQVLVPIIISVILSYLLFGVVRMLEKWRFPHLLAVILIFSLFMSLFLLACFWLLPVLWEELAELASEVPMLLNRGHALIFKLHDVFPELISIDQLQQMVAVISQYLANFGKEVVAFSLVSLFSIATAIVYLILVPLLVFFFLRDGKDIVRWFTNFLPKKRQVLQDVWYELQGKIRSYIRGIVIEIIIVAVLTIIAFEILGLRYALLLGALTGLSVVIPYIGIVVITIPIVVIGIMQWGMASSFFYLLLVHTMISILDANILVPVLFSEAMNLHPLAIILAVLIFGNLFGFWGVFFAIPLMTLVNVVVKSWPKDNC
jgi:putative permease